MNLDQLSLMLMLFGGAALVQVVALRKRLLGLADPLTYIVVTSSFSVALGVVVVDDPAVMTMVLFYFICFYAGLMLTNRPTPAASNALTMNADNGRFRVVVLAFAVVYFGLNAFIWARSGVILFSSDPSLQKAEAYVGGFGFVRRFNWSAGTFALIASLYLWLWERSSLSVLALTLSMLAALAGGAKGALLPVVLALGLYAGHPFMTRRGRNLAQLVKRTLPLVVLAAAVPVAIVLMAERGTAGDAFDALMVRLFAFGDVLLYWGQGAVRRHFADLGFVALLRDDFASILGMLRLIDYTTQIGNQFVQFVLPAGFEFSDALGPNLAFYVRGELFLGPVMAPFHAFAVGLVCGRVRQMFLDYRGSSLHRYTLLSFLAAMSASLPSDESFVIGQVFDFLVYGGFVYLLVFALTGHSTTRPAAALPMASPADPSTTQR